MSFDGIAVAAIVNELNTFLKDGRVDKIYQPTQNEINIIIRNKGKNHRLLISAHPQWARVQITNYSMPNPDHPPMFCMLLRKHLENSRVIDISQHNLERIINITFEGIDEIGETVRRNLFCEIMGKHSNIILIDLSSNKILDGIFRYSYAVSQHRQVLPGQSYVLPPGQAKINFLNLIDEEEFINLLLSADINLNINKALLNKFLGLGPQTCRELIHRAGLSPEVRLEFLGAYELNKLWQEINNLATTIRNGNFIPEIVQFDEKINAFAPINLTIYETKQRQQTSTLSEAMDLYYQHKIHGNILEQKVNDLDKVIKRELERCYKKASIQENTLIEAKDAEQYRIWGDLLMSNLYNLQQSNEVKLINFYEEDQKEITILLDPIQTPAENAKNYYKKYQKAKHGAEKAKVHLEETQNEIKYLESVAVTLDGIDDNNDLEGIRNELIETGYLKPKNNKKGKKQQEISGEPIKLNIKGYDILIGKNNKQNDLITLRIAKPQDIWLHVKDIPGSHVIIRNPQDKIIPNEILEKAAILAAYYSKAKHSATVPVDYVEKKHVRKPKGAKPGMVIYDNQTTVYITPNEEKVKELL